MVRKKVPRDAIAFLRLLLDRTASVPVCRMCPTGANAPVPPCRAVGLGAAFI